MLTGKGKRFCLAKWQASQGSIGDTVIFETCLCKIESVLAEGWPNCRCQIFALEEETVLARKTWGEAFGEITLVVRKYKPSKSLAVPIISEGWVEWIWHDWEENVKKQSWEAVNRDTDRILKEKWGRKRTLCKVKESEIQTVPENCATVLEPVGRRTLIGGIDT